MFLYNLNNKIYDYKCISNDVFCSAILYGLMAHVNSQSGIDPVMRGDRDLMSLSSHWSIVYLSYTTSRILFSPQIVTAGINRNIRMNVDSWLTGWNYIHRRMHCYF